MIAVLTDPSCGGTFLTWSLYYLSGQSEYYSVKQQQKISLIFDPITSSNAHGFRPNQPLTLENFNNQIDTLSNRPSEEFNVIYVHNFNDCNRMPGGSTSIAIDTITKYLDKIVCLTISPQNLLYKCSYNKRSFAFDPETGKFFSSHRDVHDHFIKTYFEQNQRMWAEQGLTEIWDQREFLALNYRPFDHFQISEVHSFDFDHYYLDSIDLCTQFDSTVIKLFKYLELDIHLSRWESWLEVYNRWKKIHYQLIRFSMYFDTIMRYILQGKSMDLESFDLDIMQESAIQHQLIYNHNLNLKTWQLNKFLNTQQLHSLLEPNTHPMQ